MRAYHNDPAIKDFYVYRVRQHRLADEIIHGVYWERGRGCGVGCTLHSGHHAAYETELGIPRILALLEDALFEALTPPQDLVWPEQFLEAIPVGADLALVWPRFVLRLLADPDHGVLQYVQHAQHGQQKEAIGNIIKYYQTWVETGLKPAVAAAAHAAIADATAAADAATYAATATAYAAAAHAAIADATAAANAATYATTATATSYAVAAAAVEKRYAIRLWQSQTLLTLLRAAPLSEYEESLSHRERD